MSGWVVEAKSVEELAEQAYEDLMGHQGEGGHKPARPDIAKLREAYDEESAAKKLRDWGEGGIFKYKEDHPQEYEELKELSDKWEESTRFTDREHHAFLQYNGDRLAQGVNEQKAFERAAEKYGKDTIANALKKTNYYQQSALYNNIKTTLDDLSRMSASSYKLWPWAVKELKRQYQETGAPDRQHLVDIVQQTGDLLHELGQANRTPQGVDANNFKSLQEMQDWLYQYRRENGVGDDGGKVHHEFDDGWKVLQLNDPRQLEWEGEQMDHCFPPGILVISREGSKRIEEINIGDEVLSHDNQYHKVKKVLRRFYQGTLLEFVTDYGTVRSTLSHKFLTYCGECETSGEEHLLFQEANEIWPEFGDKLVYYLDLLPVEIIEIKESRYEGYVYDIRNVADSHSYVANGFIVGNCVGGYWAPVRDKQSYIYSVRDPENKPQATLEFLPSEYHKDEYGNIIPMWKHNGQGDIAEDSSSPRDSNPDSLSKGRISWPNFEPADTEPFNDESGPYYGLQKKENGEDLYGKVLDPIENPQRTAFLKQHMGVSDSTPNSQANEHIKEWLDHHRQNGWNIERAPGFFYPDDWDDDQGLGGGDEGRHIENDGYSTYDSAVDRFSNWWQDHFRSDPAFWTKQGNQTDVYGFPKEPNLNVDWNQLHEGLHQGLATNESYPDSSKVDMNPDEAAKAYWYLHHLYGDKRHGILESKLGDIQDMVDRDFDRNLNYVDVLDDDVHDKYEDQGGKFEDQDDIVPYGTPKVPLDRDLWYDIHNEMVQRYAEEPFEGNNIFLNYLHGLNYRYPEGMTPEELYNHHVNNTFPQPDQLNDSPPASPPAPSTDENIPGAL